MKVADIFASGAVLQRRKNICIWGEDAKAATVAVTLADVTAKTNVENGKWMVTLPAFEAAENLTLAVKNDIGEEIILNDIAIGEVWIAGGQSNMEFPMKCDAERESVLPDFSNTSLRFYECPKISYEGQLVDEDHSDEGVWRKAVPGDSGYFSAVGFYFSNKLQESLKDVPIAIIGCNWGGTSASCWMTDEYLGDDLSFYVEMREKTKELDLGDEFEKYKKTHAMQMSPEAKKGMEQFLATPILAPMPMPFTQEELEAFLRTKYAPFSPFSAQTLYDTMLSKIIPYTAAGVIWYQGEEDAAFPEHYTKLLTRMIRCWRNKWGEELPFIIAQLTAYTNPGNGQMLDFTDLRAAQELVCKTVNDTYLVCTMDAGLQYDIHPKQKRPVGERMALQALNNVYGVATISEAPEVCGAYKESGKVTIKLLHCGDGLTVKGDKAESMELVVNGKAESCEVSVCGSEMIVISDNIREDSRVELRYEQKDYCVANVFGGTGIPVRPFIVKL